MSVAGSAYDTWADGVGRRGGGGYRRRVQTVRQCSRTACGHVAVATLTYVYADSTAVLGPLSQLAEPHAYDLCAGHAERLTVPLGWEVVRLDIGAMPSSPDDLLALADAVRESRRPIAPALEPVVFSEPLGRQHAHLRVLDGEG